MTPASEPIGEGYFPRGRSMLRRVHSERAVGLLYGQRGLAIGALNPRAFVGTWEHTHAQLKPFQRLAHTAKAFEAVFFGTREEADEVLAMVERMHGRVRGAMPEDAGPVRAGAPYSAFDPELMLWTMAVIADSGQTFYELLVRELDSDEREALWADYVRFGELFGMPRDVAPATYRDWREWWAERMAGDDLHLTPQALQTGYASAFEIPLPGVYGLAMRMHNLIMLGSLPARVRELYGLRWTPAHAVAFRAAVTAARGSRPLVPRPVRRGPNTDAFELVAKTERRRLAAVVS
jgi:uncharacterized protein (DUF2236 family)